MSGVKREEPRVDKERILRVGDWGGRQREERGRKEEREGAITSVITSSN